MSIGSNFDKIKKRIEGLSLGIKLVVGVGSAYLLYRKWQSMQEEEEIKKITQSTISAAQSGGVVGATKPLVTPSAEQVPHSTPQVLPYAKENPDKVVSGVKLPIPEIKPLDPNQIASQAIEKLSLNASSWFG